MDYSTQDFLQDVKWWKEKREQLPPALSDDAHLDILAESLAALYPPPHIPRARAALLLSLLKFVESHPAGKSRLELVRREGVLEPASMRESALDEVIRQTTLIGFSQPVVLVLEDALRSLESPAGKALS